MIAECMHSARCSSTRSLEKVYQESDFSFELNGDSRGINVMLP